jgi:hypothetical protein
MWNGLTSVATLTPNCVPEAMLQLAYLYVLLWVLLTRVGITKSHGSIIHSATREFYSIESELFMNPSTFKMLSSGISKCTQMLTYDSR